MSSVSTQKIEAQVKKDASWALGALRKFSENRCAAMAASIAFYSAFSLAPTLVMVIAVTGWVFGPEAVRGQLFHQVNGLIGDQAAASVQSIVENAHRSRGTGIAAIISFVLLAVGASATFASLNTALNIVWPMSGDQRSGVMAIVHVRLISFGLVLGVAFLLIVSLVLDTAIQAVGMWLWGDSPFVIVGDVMQMVVGLVILSMAFGALLKFLPDAPVQWHDALVGELVAAVLFSAGKKLFAVYPDARGNGERIRRGRLARGAADVALLFGGRAAARRGVFCSAVRAHARSARRVGHAEQRPLAAGQPREDRLDARGIDADRHAHRRFVHDRAGDARARKGRRTARAERASRRQGPGGRYPPWRGRSSCREGSRRRNPWPRTPPRWR